MSTPYTDEDLRAEAAREVKYTLDNIDTDGLLEASTHELGDGSRWEQLSEGDWREALRQVDDLVEGAADVSEWAISLGADGLQPHARVIDIGWNDGPLDARIHIAFRADMPPEEREHLVTDLSNAIAGTVPVR